MKCSLTLTIAFVMFTCYANAETAGDRRPLCKVAGQVVQDPSGQPIRKADVELVRIGGQRDTGYQVATDSEGKFSISGIDPGHYRLVVHRDGFFPQKKAEILAGHILSLVPGQSINQLQIKMQPTAVVTGTVRDGDGDPVVGARVQVMPTSVKPVFGFVSPAFTNDLGEYRIGNLPPGRYLVLAVPRTQYRMLSAEDGAQRTRNEDKPYPTYYPGTPDKAQAVPLEVRAGDEVSADVNILDGPSFTIHGRVDGQSFPISNQQLVLSSADGGVLPTNLETAQMQADGSFSIRDVLPGHYLAQLMSIDDSGKVKASVLGRVEVRSMDIDNLHLSVTPPSTILGSLRIEGTSQSPLSAYHVVLVPTDTDSNGDTPSGVLPVSANVGKDGSFEFQNVAAGTYMPAIWTESAQRQNLFVKTVSLAGRAADEGLIIAGGTYRVDVLASTKSARLEGTVLDDKGEPSAGATVVAIPQGKLQKHPNAFRVENADQNGRFQMPGLMPGEYTILATQDLDEDYRDPDFLQRHGGADQTLRLSQEEDKSVSLKLQAPSGN